VIGRFLRVGEAFAAKPSVKSSQILGLRDSLWLARPYETVPHFQESDKPVACPSPVLPALRPSLSGVPPASAGTESNGVKFE
jgi:hypothetical protein